MNNFAEKIFNSQELTKKIEFITIQSSEQREDEIRYKNINRKQILLDLNDSGLMTLIGNILRPYGMKHWIENKLAQSKIEIFRLIGEKKLAKRAMKFIRLLFLKYPEKFSGIVLSNGKSTKMEMIRGTLVISEVVNQKTISLKDNRENYLSEIESLRKKFNEEEKKLIEHEALVKALTTDHESNLISMGA